MEDENLGTHNVYEGYTEDCPFEIDVYGSDGVSPAALALADVVHCVISERVKGEPDDELLAVNSDEPTDNDSIIVISDRGNAITGDPVVGYVRLAEDDTAAIVAEWDDEVRSKHLVFDLFFTDDSETDPADARKFCGRGVIHLHRS